MPSGFQQDQNQLTPSYYRVVINMGALGEGSSATWYTVDNNDGDNTTGRISTYAWDSMEGNNRPATLEVAQALARGNLRFQYIVEAIENLADCQILDVENWADTNATAMADNGSIAFTIKFDRDEGVFPALCAIKKAQDWNSNGNTYPIDGVVYPQYYAYVDNGDTVNNTADAIRDVIWLALKHYNPATDNNITRSRSTRVFHPVEGTDPLEGEGFQEVVETEYCWDNDGNAWSDIGVTEIDGTTTTISAD